MKKTVLVFLLLATASMGIFAISSFTLETGVITSATPVYAIGVNLKSIGTLGFELTIEGNMGNSFDLTKLGSIKKWNFMPTIFLSLPTGEIRPYAGVGILTTYDVETSNFGPVIFQPLYYKAGVDMFLSYFAFFVEAQGTLDFQPKFEMSGIEEWRIGAGLAF